MITGNEQMMGVFVSCFLGTHDGNRSVLFLKDDGRYVGGDVVSLDNESDDPNEWAVIFDGRLGYTSFALGDIKGIVQCPIGTPV